MKLYAVKMVVKMVILYMVHSPKKNLGSAPKTIAFKNLLSTRYGESKLRA